MTKETITEVRFDLALMTTRVEDLETKLAKSEEEHKATAREMVRLGGTVDACDHVIDKLLDIIRGIDA